MKHGTWAAGPLMILGVACGPDAATEQDYDDLAVALSGLTAGDGGDMEAVLDAADLALGGQSLQEQGEGQFEWERGSATYTYIVECFDRRDAPLPDCDVRTRRATAAVEISAERDTDRRQAGFERQGDWRLQVANDLSRVTVDGSVSTSMETTVEALNREAMRSFRLVAEGSYQSLEVDVGSRELVGGRIEINVTAERMRSNRFQEIEASFDVDVVIEFAPGVPPTLILDGDRRYQVVDGQTIRADL